jgi:hypothetical protein
MIRVPFSSKILIGLLLTFVISNQALSQCSTDYPFDPHCPLPTAGLNAALTPVHVPDNATLKLTSVVDHQNAVFRDGFYLRGDAGPPLLFTGLVGNCVANGLVDNGGLCVDVDVSAGGGSWKASVLSTGVDPAQFGLGAFWTAPGAYTYKIGGTLQSPTFQWQNGGLVALTAGGSYDMYYNCKGL